MYLLEEFVFRMYYLYYSTIVEVVELLFVLFCLFSFAFNKYHYSLYCAKLTLCVSGYLYPSTTDFGLFSSAF